jgi:hypothetical protein
VRTGAVPAARAAALAGLLALASACRPVPRGDARPPPAGEERACPANVDPYADRLRLDVGGRALFVRRGASTFEFPAGSGYRPFDSSLGAVLAAAGAEDAWFAVGCRRARQVLVRLADLDGDGVPAEVASERELSDPGVARELAWDAKRRVLYVYVVGGKGARVLRLPDDDRDGVPDREQRFVDSATHPALEDDGASMWVQAADGEVVLVTWDGCIVGDGDHVTSIRDDDGDGVPETVERTTASVWHDR